MDVFARDATVLALGRWKGNDECEDEVGAGETGDWLERAAWEGGKGVEASEAAEGDLEDIGTVKFCRLKLEPSAELGGKGLVSSSRGISSAAGIGRPLAAATN